MDVGGGVGVKSRVGVKGAGVGFMQGSVISKEKVLG